jgi:CheY-like chemotaxis protein
LSVRCDAASSCGEAIDEIERAHASNDPYQVAIIDQQITTLDRVRHVQALKSATERHGTHIVIMASVGRRAEVKSWREAGFVAHLVKPVYTTQLMNTLVLASDPRTKSADGADALGKPSPSGVTTPGKDRVIRARVLVAEDNIVNQRVAARLLEKLGCRVHLAANGAEVIEMLELLDYDLVFMDCQMPIKDGYQATREIREHEQGGRRVPVVAMTANAMVGDREQCLAAGMDDYLAKPVRVEELRRVLDRWLESPPGPG